MTHRPRGRRRQAGVAGVARGFDPTGKGVAEAYFAVNADAALANYQKVCDIREPFYENDAFQAVDRWVGEANLFMPLSDDGETVNKIMVFSINRDLYQRCAVDAEGALARAAGDEAWPCGASVPRRLLFSA